MSKPHIAVIGVGGMGSYHAKIISESDHMELAAVCDIVPDKAESIAARYETKAFYNHADLLEAGVCDAVLIATPHYAHTTIGIDALQAGLHVLVEKPISVHKADCERLIAAHTNKSQVFAAMFNQRTDSCYKKVRRIFMDGELGELQRVNWIITDWFRTESYYRSSDWRATWEGEGGGVLLNQCPHNLDLLQWICGMPVMVQGFCKLGKYHDIEVEDDVTAYFEYENGATGVFVTTTGEAPGTNRLEITGDRGKIVIENGAITFVRTEESVREFCQTSDSLFGTPDVWNISVPVPNRGGQHKEILHNFADAIAGKAELIAPAPEGIHSVELANAILYSSLQGKPVQLPLDGMTFETALKDLIANSTFDKKTQEVSDVDMDDSF
jgi:predicted dehydrogenase